jgi:hypothetical protein
VTAGILIMKSALHSFIAGIAALAVITTAGQAQEKFIDVRQAMADALTAAKEAGAKADWPAARAALEKGAAFWNTEVKPLIAEGLKTSPDYKEYADRTAEVDGNLEAAATALEAQKSPELAVKINAAIWGISHHPRGFDVPPPRYTAWDWVFALAIGLGFCAAAIWFGLYLRRSYYSRYPRAKFVK